MFTTQFWLIVIGFAKMLGCCWIYNKFQERSYKRKIRSCHSYVLLAILLAEEEKLEYNSSKCNEDGTGEVYLGLPQGIVKVFSHGSDKYDILSYAKTYLEPKQQELQMAWKRRMEEIQQQ